jgi:hypothetical protein
MGVKAIIIAPYKHTRKAWEGERIGGVYIETCGWEYEYELSATGLQIAEQRLRVCAQGFI